MLEIPEKVARIAPRQSSGVRYSKIMKVNAGVLSEAAFRARRGVFSELKRIFPVRYIYVETQSNDA